MLKANYTQLIHRLVHMLSTTLSTCCSHGSSHVFHHTANEMRLPVHPPTLFGNKNAQAEKPGLGNEMCGYGHWCDPSEALWQKVHGARLFDRVGDSAMELGGDSRHAAREDFTSLGGELGEQLGIGVNDLTHRDVMPTARHLAVRLAEVNTALNCFWLRHGSRWIQRSSRWRVRRLRKGLNFTFSRRPGVRRLFLLRVVT